MSHPVRIGLKLAPQNCTLEQLRGVWVVADQAGFDHVWDFDHLAPIRSDPSGTAFEGWMLLAAMAEATKRVRIGVMVTANPLRHPALLAKMASTVDHLSGGRLEFGIGAGWAEEEFRMLGIDFPGARERIERLDEACQVLKLLWTESPAGFEGRYYRLQGAHSKPFPVQRPQPPIWIGGQGERRTLRVVARHAGVWNFSGDSVEEGRRLSAVLDGHCREVDRDPSSIRRSVQTWLDASDPAAATDRLHRFVEAGFTELVLMLRGPDAAGAARVAADEVLPRIRSSFGS